MQVVLIRRYRAHKDEETDVFPIDKDPTASTHWEQFIQYMYKEIE